MIGDTLHFEGDNDEYLPELRANQAMARAMLFAGIFSETQTEHINLRTAQKNLISNDSV